MFKQGVGRELCERRIVIERRYRIQYIHNFTGVEVIDEGKKIFYFKK